MGLARQGIASIRFDKRTLIYPYSFSNIEYTPQQEVIDDAATQLLSKFPNQKIPLILLEHSQGGTFLPQIAKQINQPISGYILMAVPSSGKIYNDALRQYKYIATQVPTEKENLLKIADDLQQQIINWDNYKKNHVQNGTFPMNLPKSYLEYIESYSPTERMKDQNKTTLVLQGEKDYNVLATADFIEWQTVLKPLGNKAQFRLYLNLTHTFIQMDQQETIHPHVNQQVIEDIGKRVNTNILQ